MISVTPINSASPLTCPTHPLPRVCGDWTERWEGSQCPPPGASSLSRMCLPMKYTHTHTHTHARARACSAAWK